MSRKDGSVYLHVRMRAQARYGIELPRHVWDSWNEHLESAPVIKTKPNGLQVRLFKFHGIEFHATCSKRRVLTVLTK